MEVAKESRMETQRHEESSFLRMHSIKQSKTQCVILAALPFRFDANVVVSSWM
jgi:hypothetical protein